MHYKTNPTYRIGKRWRAQWNRLIGLIQSGDFKQLSARRQSSILRKVRLLAKRMLNLQPSLRRSLGGAALLTALTLTPAALQAQEVTFELNEDSPVSFNSGEGINLLQFVDLDNDGDLDALINSGEYGSILYYENQGTADEANFMPVEENPFDGLEVLGISMGDLDGDGDLDLITATYEGGDILFVENIGTAESPEFSISSETVIPPTPYTIYTMVDMDQDGDLDLVGSSYAEYTNGLSYYENIGTPEEPSFGAISEAIFDAVEASETSYFNFPTFVDLDQDGDLDMFIGQYGYSAKLNYFENVSENVDEPEFVLSANPIEYTLEGDGYFVTVAFADLDNDGDADAFVSEYSGTISYHENTTGDISIGIESVVDPITVVKAGPNPFSSNTNISFDLMETSDVRLEVYAANGQLVRVLLDGQLAGGTHQVNWDGADMNGTSLSNGQYICRLTAGGKQQSLQLSLFK